MASPVGHCLLGLGVYCAAGPTGPLRSWRGLAFAAAVPLVPDLDFVPGLLLGDANRYHQGVSHTLLAALVWGGLVALVAAALRWRSPLRLGVLGGVLYASHLFLDFFCHDGRAPFGQPLLWPLVPGHFISPWAPLHGIRHGVPGEALPDVLRDIFSPANAVAVLREALFLAPLLLPALYLTRARASAPASQTSLPTSVHEHPDV